MEPTVKRIPSLSGAPAARKVSILEAPIIPEMDMKLLPVEKNVPAMKPMAMEKMPEKIQAVQRLRRRNAMEGI